MASNVLIISRGSAFMTDALAKNLQKAEINAKVTEPNIRAIGREREDTDIYLI